MKRTLQVVMAALALASVSVTAQAQGGGGGGGGPGRGGAAQRAALFEGITLTADQQAKVDTAYAQASAKMAEVGIQRGTPPTDEQRQKQQAINADRTKAIKAILTAEQVAIYDKNVEKMAANRRPPPSL